MFAAILSGTPFLSGTLACPAPYTSTATGGYRVTSERSTHWGCAALCGANASLAKLFVGGPPNTDPYTPTSLFPVFQSPSASVAADAFSARHRKFLKKPIGNHLPRAAKAFFRRLETHYSRAIKIACI